jgi:sugar phosphate isomerase/epimerase
MSVPIALQLYSVREDCAKDLLGVIRQVADMGYDGVEFAGYHGHSAEDIKAVLDETGLKAAGTHTQWSQFDDENFDNTVQVHKTLDCQFAIIPWIPEELRNTSEACKTTAAKLTEICAKLRSHGLRTGFHAHSGDMEPLDNGQCAWDIIAANTPDDFILQYDTANGVAGGADPVKPISDWPGRNASLHLKEWRGGHGAVIGEGDVPWPRVFEAAEKGGGVEWYVVEHETESAMTPLQSVDACLKNLKKLLGRE